MRLVQILNGTAHWIFEADEIPDFPPSIEGDEILIVDITDRLMVKEGYTYTPETDEFTEPELVLEEAVLPTPPIEEQILYETKYQTMLLEMGGMV